MDELPIVHIFDVAREGQDDDGDGIYVYTSVIPRVGDHVRWWLDYPEHMAREFGDGEPIRITGVVEKVEIEYRRMEWGAPHTFKTHSMASVWLRDYVAERPKSKS